jgi:hypothetical protein
MSRRNIEFESAAHGWKLTIPLPSTALIEELVALEPKSATHETSAQLITRIMQQLAAVLRTALEVSAARAPDDEGAAAQLTPETITLEEAGHILQAVRAEYSGGDPHAVIIWLQEERHRSYGRRGMGQMHLGALLAYAQRLGV